MKNFSELVSSLFARENLSFIGSVDEHGYPQIRAMLRPRKFDGIKTIYFSTNTSSNKIRQFLGNSKACVYVCAPSSFQGALLTGEMKILQDQAHKDLLWQSGDELYYPRGAADPDYCVLRFSALTCRVYDNFVSTDFQI